MDPNPVELFFHIIGVIGMFVGFGTLVLGVWVLGRARDLSEARPIARALTFGRRVGFEHVSVIDAIVVASVLLVAATGLHMASYTGDWRSGWVKVAIASFLLLAPVGPLVIDPGLHAAARATEGDQASFDEFRARIGDSVLSLSLDAAVGVLVGIVFLMAVKPSLLISSLVIVGAALAGAASGVMSRPGRPKHPAG